MVRRRLPFSPRKEARERRMKAPPRRPGKDPSVSTKLVAENLVVGGKRLLAEALGHERQRLGRLEQILAGLTKREME
jgi:hypothetical protein